MKSVYMLLLTCAALCGCAGVDNSAVGSVDVESAEIEIPSGYKLVELQNAYSAVAAGDSIWVSATMRDGNNTTRLALFKISADLKNQECIFPQIEVENNSRIAVLCALKSGAMAMLVEDGNSSEIYIYKDRIAKLIYSKSGTYPVSMSADGDNLLIQISTFNSAELMIVDCNGNEIAKYKENFDELDTLAKEYVFFSQSTVLKDGRIALWIARGKLPDKLKGKSLTAFAATISQNFLGRLCIFSSDLKEEYRSERVQGRCLGIIERDSKIYACVDKAPLASGKAEISIYEFNSKSKLLENVAQKEVLGSNTLEAEFFNMERGAYLIFNASLGASGRERYLEFANQHLAQKELDLKKTHWVVNTAHNKENAYIFTKNIPILFGSAKLQVVKTSFCDNNNDSK